jgi:hypothetical protein
VGESAGRDADQNEGRLDRCRELCQEPGRDFRPEAEDAKAAGVEERRARHQLDAELRAADRAAPDAVASDERHLDRTADELAGRALHRDEAVAMGQDAGQQEPPALELAELLARPVLQRLALREFEQPELGQQQAQERPGLAVSELRLERTEPERRMERARLDVQLEQQPEGQQLAPQAWEPLAQEQPVRPPEQMPVQPEQLPRA